ncbi:MAG: glycosyltransferase family 4 protein [Mesorhizobium sp.]|nr:glycosyltransferase [bacterium M00.F.Ca.ET.205.01.1.1]TGU50998.1 glycosyltransferase [bacterium M00.F.Ca.ET.152.01.1.1]TGV34487.1 glycosyltransferase [Mesorhizobium sp. M00.F.Ca.ET.186.01.1.1]TGZ41844.1 glycosyltransferase [bacterium M00.F.Ca.ET.162.01.1.1]TIW62610.1 MAG: glycosyltransferase family 4 protein [Mesorhizobium sp.]
MIEQMIKKKRVFWLGMHKVLLQTELPRLRALGYEVFNPPYLSDVYDQSAVYDWLPSDSSLPREALEILERTNFFYDEIPPEAAEVLNAYFDAAIVTINPLWLVHFLKAYHGRVIYRTYGQPYSLSDELSKLGGLRLVTERDDFWFMPHSEKVTDVEDDWLRSRMMIVPYCLTQDVVDLRDTWDTGASLPEMGLLCPRVADIPYYSANYRQLKRYFPAKGYRIFGAQNVPVGDKQVIGTVERSEFLRRLTQMRGFAYHYGEPTVCYLPPIEFMTLGGPVLFQRGSLLSRYFPAEAPGKTNGIEDMVKRSEQLRKGDSAFSRELIESQAEVRELYQPEAVWPIFDRAIEKALGDTGANRAEELIYTPTVKMKAPAAKTVVVAFHGFGPLVVRHNGEYHCAEGIARVVRQIIRALADLGFKVVVTSRREDVGRIHGFLGSAAGPGMRVMVIDEEVAGGGRVVKALDRLHRIARTRPFSVSTDHLKRLYRGRDFRKMPRALASTALVAIFKAMNRAEKKFKNIKLASGAMPGAEYVDLINADANIGHVLIPHYYMFPELADLRGKDIVLYLPDYMPHFYPDSAEMGATQQYAIVGRAMVAKARRILTNSAFTASYLPKTILAPRPENIAHVPLPFLNDSAYGTESLDRVAALPRHYAFYPTRNRPSKRLSDFAKTVAIVNSRLEETGSKDQLVGLLTTPLTGKSAAGADEHLVSLAELTDAELGHLYRNALCLLFTSEMEGNFPTQITEALHLGVPVVATNIPLITQELGDAAASLDLVDVGDCEGFADRIMSILADRPAAIHRQQEAREFSSRKFAYDNFKQGISELFRQ